MFLTDHCSLITVHCEAVAVLQVQIIPQYNIVGLNRGSGLRVSTQSCVLTKAASQKIGRELEAFKSGSER